MCTATAVVEFADGTNGIEGFAELFSFGFILKFVAFVIILESAEFEFCDPR